MTQDERWLVRYKEVMGFLEENHRNPSKHRIEEHDMLNWLKANRKVLNAGNNCRLSSRLDKVRVNSALCSLFRKFKELLAMTELYRRKNQYQ